MMRLSIVATLAFLIVATASAAPKPIKWKPDRAFAKVVKLGFQKANKGAVVSEDVCVKPDLPKQTAMTAGLAQEDCLVVATSNGKPLCFELQWQNGASGTRLPCAEVKKAIRDDARPGWVVHYRHAAGFVA